MKARTIMIQGTSSSAGKSILVTALCRIFRQDGYRTTPFKSQNMALNSFVTREGYEIGRSQAVQAEAAGIEPAVDMNPVLLKPQADNQSQLIVYGRPAGTVDARSYYQDKSRFWPLICKAFKSLSQRYDLIVIEGAGSPAEINLMSDDIANMRVARMAGAPVLLVADIDRGGVFASLAGTMQLLKPSQRKMVKGFIINRFRGDASLLKSGLDFLEKRYSRPVLGVIPHMKELTVAQEDSVYLDERRNTHSGSGPDVCIIHLPHISNYDDFDPLEQSCKVRYIKSADEMGDPDLIILPGTKSTISDMDFLYTSGLSHEVLVRAGRGTPVIGICGGYQMLGKAIYDPDHVESSKSAIKGLGLLDIETIYRQDKITMQIKGMVAAKAGLLQNMEGIPIEGYQIHMGRDLYNKAKPAFFVRHIDGSCIKDGASNTTGMVFGTYTHGLFNSNDFTRIMIDNLCSLRGLRRVDHRGIDREEMFNRLADTVRKSLDMGKIYDIIAGG